MPVIEVPAEYGYVVLSVFASFFVLTWMGIQVGKARKKYDVKYPAMYSDKDPIFNCIQRAHQNTLENIGYYFVFTLIGGLQHPLFVTGSSLVYLAGRVVYALGYYTGVSNSIVLFSVLWTGLALFIHLALKRFHNAKWTDPEGRLKGSFGYLGLLGLVGSFVSFAIHLLGWV